MDPKAALSYAVDETNGRADRMEAVATYRRWIASGGFPAELDGRKVADVWLGGDGRAYARFLPTDDAYPETDEDLTLE